MSRIKQVNWVDSMEIRADQFIQSENFFLSAIADTAGLGLNGCNYGLLPAGTAADSYNGIRVNEHVTGHIEVNLYSCNAVTASGFRICFEAQENGGPLIKSYSPAQDTNVRNRDIRQWDIILSVDPFKRTPSGIPDPNEQPPRHPDCQSTYALYVMPAGEINTQEFGHHFLTIGRLRKDGERYVVDSQYIPPCASMSSHPDLTDYYNRFATMFSSLEKSSKAIIDKIQERANRSELAVNIQGMCRDLLLYIARIYFDFRNRGRLAPPVEIINYVASTAHTCYAALTLISSRQQEEMLKYFYEWTDVSPGSFKELLADTLEIMYEHDNLRAMMVRSENFLRTLSELWERLARLEFIGQHKESIVVSERSQEMESGTPKRSWSITD
ncbi:MAG: type VI secretion system membrane-associated complex protein TssK [Bacteroides sp.]|nr:type VI secretion system membrane-associated complex protein TssK [Bacteroides sp.]